MGRIEKKKSFGPCIAKALAEAFLSPDLSDCGFGLIVGCKVQEGELFSRRRRSLCHICLRGSAVCRNLPGCVSISVQGEVRKRIPKEGNNNISNETNNIYRNDPNKKDEW